MGRSWRHTIGKIAEILACIYLVCTGWHLLAVNFRARQGESDIIACKGETLAVVEVKFRRRRMAAHLAIHPTQRARLQQQAAAALRRYGRRTKLKNARVDAVLIYPHRPFLEHITNALGS